MDSVSNGDILLVNSLNDSSEGDDSLSDFWSLFFWESWKHVMKSFDLLSDSGNSVNKSSFLVDQIVNDWSDDWVELTWSSWSTWSAWSSWSFSKWSSDLESDGSNSLLQVNNSLVSDSDDLNHFSNSSLEDRSLVFWNIWKLFSESSDGSSDLDNSLNKSLDSVSDGSNDSSFDLGDWSWFDGRSFNRSLVLWSVSDRMNSLSDNSKSSDNSWEGSLENNNLLLDDWSSWFWGRNKFILKVLDGLSDNGNSVDELRDSSGDSVNDGLFNVNQRSLWLSSSWSLNVGDNMGDRVNLFGDSNNMLLQNINSVDKGWSAIFWLLRKLVGQLQDSLSDDGSLVSKFDDSLCQCSDDSLFNNSEKIGRAHV